MKVVLAALNAKYVHSNLAVYDLAAYAKAHDPSKLADIDLEVKEYTINQNLDSIMKALYLEKPCVVAFSCYIWNISEILTIAKELKKVLPKVRIWLGGPEVSYNSREVLVQNPCIEGIMQGEGEATFLALLTAWRTFYTAETQVEEELGKDYRNISGIVYAMPEGEIQENPVRELIALDELPFIYQDMSVFQNKILYYETSRGCPFSCSYCLSSIEKKVRFRSLHLVKQELQFFFDHQVAQVKFIDRTFNCHKEHALAIWTYLLEHDNGITNFHFEVAADLIGEEELRLFKRMRPGLIQLEIGLQSTNAKTIQEIHRTMNIEKVKQVLLTIREFGNIHQHLDLIAGLPYEDFATFVQSFNDAYAMKPNQLQLGFLKVLKGSYMEEQVKNYGIQFQETQPYEVLSTNWITYDEILVLKNVEEMVEVYHNSDQFEHVLPYVISFFDTPFSFYQRLGEYYEKRDLFGIGVKREARYTVLRDFVETELKDEKNFSVIVFEQLLTYDYYLREKAKTRPEWAKKEAIEKSIYQNFFKNAGNEELSFREEQYDSKVAARKMHIEPLQKETLEWIEEILVQTKKDVLYCVFDYEHRNPLTKDAKVIAITHL